jgi:hypothetical protein
MKSPFYFIVEPVGGRRYDNVKKIGDIDFITSTSQEDHTASNRFAKVIACPSGYDGPIKPGHKLVVHHNVFKFYYDMKGREKSGFSFLKDNTFFLEDNQFYMYHDGDKWNTIGDFCFVTPIDNDDELTTYRYKHLVGKIRYNNTQLQKLGVNQGDLVCFTPYSEYEFDVDGEKVYRMRVKDISVLINGH